MKIEISKSELEIVLLILETLQGIGDENIDSDDGDPGGYA